MIAFARIREGYYLIEVCGRNLIIRKIFLFFIILFLVNAANRLNASSKNCVHTQVTAIQLNIRSTPSTAGNVIGKLNQHDVVCAYDQKGNWVEIENGWVSAKYLVRVVQPVMHTTFQTTSTSGTSAYSRTVPYGQPVVKTDMSGEIATSILVLIAAIYVVMLLVGMAGKVVVYYDEADLVISLLPWFVLFVTFILGVIYQPMEQDLDPDKMLQIQKFVWYAGGLISTGLAIWTIQLSIKYNRSIPIGFFFGVFKLLSGLIGVLVLISQVFTMKDEKTKRKDFWFAILVFGAFWWLGKKLINGKKVYREKGWSLPK